MMHSLIDWGGVHGAAVAVDQAPKGSETMASARGRGGEEKVDHKITHRGIRAVCREERGGGVGGGSHTSTGRKRDAP